MPVIPEYGKQWNEKFKGQHYLYYTRLEKKREKRGERRKKRVWTTTSTKLLAD